MDRIEFSIYRIEIPEELKEISVYDYIRKLEDWLEAEHGGWDISGTDCPEDALPDIIVEYYEHIKEK